MYHSEEDDEEHRTNDDILEENEEKEDVDISENKEESRECKSPTEERFGDDESKQAESEQKTRRRTKRNVRVEEGDGNDAEVRKGGGRLHRQSSSEDEIAKSRSRVSSSGRRKVSSSEDEVASSGRKPSYSKNIKDRKASFEQSSGSEQTSSKEKRSSFSSKRANTIATSGTTESRRTSFGKTRATSVEVDSHPPRKQSSDRPGWSTSTQVNHDRVDKNVLSRKESTQSESDEPKSATQIRAKWENRKTSTSSAPKVKAAGGSTGAAALKAKFEQPRSGYQRRTSSTAGRSRTMSGEDSEDGGQKKMSALALKARFEAKGAENTPPRRNFVINKNRIGGAAKKFNMGAPTSTKCHVCTKTVYPLEKLEADGKLYHKFCFKCATCSRTVGLGNYAALQGKIYCKPHLKQLFKLKGNYDEGFGRVQRKADWVKKDGNAVSSNPSASESEATNGHADEVMVNGTDENEE